MRNNNNLLFYSYSLSEYLHGKIQAVKKEVDAISEQQFLSTDDEQIVEHLFSKLQVISIELDENPRYYDKQETKIRLRDYSDYIEVPGEEFTFTYQFSGDIGLWECTPSTYTLNSPMANVVTTGGNTDSGLLEIAISKPSDSLDNKEIDRDIEKTLKNIREYLDWIRKDVESFNQNLRSSIMQYVANRRKRLGKVAEIVKALDIPLKQKPDAQDIIPLPIKRRLVRPLPATSNKQPEPGIRDEDYEHILKVIRHEGRSFEATPKTFAIHDEEELRNIILAHLNGHYEGEAKGEAFRKIGRIDILIEDQNRAAFVGECKIWRGQAIVNDALKQLSGYLTWRDCKCALIFFNTENAGFTEIQNKLPQALEKHLKYIRKLDCNEQGEWRYRFQSLNDEKHEITIHVFLFDLFVNEPEKEDLAT